MTGGHDREARFVFDWLEYEVLYRANKDDRAQLKPLMDELLDMLDRDAVSGEDLDWDVYRHKVKEIRKLVYRRELDADDAGE